MKREKKLNFEYLRTSGFSRMPRTMPNKLARRWYKELENRWMYINSMMNKATKLMHAQAGHLNELEQRISETIIESGLIKEIPPEQVEVITSDEQ